MGLLPNTGGGRYEQKNVPIPDPSILTTEQLRREVGGLRELIETRLDGMDKAAELLELNLNRIQVTTERQLTHLKELHDEKFISIQKQFDERDVRSKASEDAAKVAVNAALQAQKEAAAAQNEANAAAITKSEATTAKQIDGIVTLLSSNKSALDDKISTINGRLDRSEGKTTGFSSNLATGIAVVAVLVAMIGAGSAMLRAGGGGGGGARNTDQGSVALTVPTVPAR